MAAINFDKPLRSEISQSIIASANRRARGTKKKIVVSLTGRGVGEEVAGVNSVKNVFDNGEGHDRNSRGHQSEKS